MEQTSFLLLPMDRVDHDNLAPSADWLWHGYIARGSLTLLTSQWKAGKTTLLTGLLQQWGAGGTFLGRAVTPAKVLVVSEESRSTWHDRLLRMPVGPHAQLLARPFPTRPNPTQWQTLVTMAGDLRKRGELDVMIVDPLAKFLPGSTESDLAAVLALLDPLQQLAEEGVGVCILHHPRKKPSEDGHSARGSGGLLAAVDIIMELHRYSKISSDHHRRKLIAMGRQHEIPKELIYEWDPESGAFTVVDNPWLHRYEENWALLESILQRHKVMKSPQELLDDWPQDRSPPSRTVLYDWLNRAYEEKRVRRCGLGRKNDPYLYRLPTAADEPIRTDW